MKNTDNCISKKKHDERWIYDAIFILFDYLFIKIYSTSAEGL